VRIKLLLQTIKSVACRVSNLFLGL